jgi:hypothetical protein
VKQVLATLLLASALVAAERGKGPVTLVLNFEGEQSATAVGVMKQEVAKILKGSVARVDFLIPDERGVIDEPGNLIVVKFRGNCRMKNSPPLAPLYDERGPLAFTYTTDGDVMPFSEVECDRVTRSVWSVLWGGERSRADELLGRALGRVVAHELYHILGNRSQHGSDGVAKTALRGGQLIADRLELQPSDVEKMLHQHTNQK